MGSIEKQIARLVATLPAAQAETECATLFAKLARIHEIRMAARQWLTSRDKNPRKDEKTA